jgi:SulP family sulfate permease
MSQPLPAPAKETNEADALDEGAEPELPLAGFRNFFFRRLPAFDSLRQYTLSTFWSDGQAGLTVALVAVPQAMAYATVAGLPPQHGLYAAIVITAVAALLTPSRQLISGPTNIISIAVLSALAPLAGQEDKVSAAIVLAFLVGLIQTGITVLRLGDLNRYISHAVVVGFTAGAAVLLIAGQIGHLLGLAERGEAGDYFLKRLWLTLAEGGPVHGWTLAIGTGTILIVLLVSHLNRRLRAHLAVPLPELLAAIVVMGFLVWVLGLEEKGVSVIGSLSARMPAFRLPDLEWPRLQQLSGSALAIAVLGLLEAISMAKSIAGRTGQKLNVNQQCLSDGLANLAGSFFQCYPGSGSLTRSAINYRAGAKTQWSGVISAGGVTAMVLLFAPFAQYVPRAALAGILMVSAWRIVNRHELLYYLRATRFDAGIVAATALSAVFVSAEFCILIGIFLSFVLYVPRAARVHCTELVLTPERVIRERNDAYPPCGRILLFSLEGELFFGAAPVLDWQLSGIDRRARDGIRIVILRLKRVRNPDAVCLTHLETFIKSLEQRGIIVLLCGVRRDLAKALQNTGLKAHLGAQRVFLEAPSVWSSTLEAVRYAYDLVGSDYCSTCPRRNDNEDSKESWYYMI